LPRIRHHVNPFHLAFLSTGAAPVPLAERGEVEVELGCADARFLFERAAARPLATCIGVEIRRDHVADVNQRAAEARLANLRAVFANISEDLDVLFPDGRLARVFINFPDPWFKRRHHKRRVMTAEVAALLHRKIAPGGELFFQSDVFDIALDAMASVEETELFFNARGPWSFLGANPYDAKSLREVRCEERAIPIWRLLYRR
jgi:tRNA (guanine-N7-)-methyltransferase